MMKIFNATIIIFLFHLPLLAQTVCSGQIVEAGTLKPLISASVFISNSSYGTTTDNLGNFRLGKVPNCKFSLIVSSIGYETFVIQLDHGKLLNPLKIELVHKTSVLGEVVVSAAEKNGWADWGDLFVENFIGKSVYARDCRIKNPKALKFRRSAKDNILKVWSDEPLLIENNALGYTIRYDLREFTFSFADNSVSYSGYPLFNEMNLKDTKNEAKIKQNRKNVYSISLMHFIRSLYNNTTAKEGFRIMRVVNKTQIELSSEAASVPVYDGVEKFDTVYEINNRETKIKIIPAETTLSTLDNNRVAAEQTSINSIIDERDDNKFLFFKDTLQIVYTHARAPNEYMQYDKNSKGLILSAISMLMNSPVAIFANGNYFPNSNLTLSGFWGWWEKIGIMLPYDYEPE